MDMGERLSEKGERFSRIYQKNPCENPQKCAMIRSVGKVHAQIWFIGRTLASQAGKAGSIPVICFLQGLPHVSATALFCYFFNSICPP